MRAHKPLGAPLTDYSALDAILFSPRGHTLIYPTANGIRLFDVRSGEQIALLSGRHQGQVSNIGLSGDGHTLASIDGATVRLWNVRTHRQIGPALPIKADEDTDLALGPDGRTLAYVDGKAVRLLDTRTRRQLLPPLQGKNLEVVTVSFSREGRTLLANGWYDASRLWDVRTGAGWRPAALTARSGCGMCARASHSPPCADKEAAKNWPATKASALYLLQAGARQRVGEFGGGHPVA